MEFKGKKGLIFGVANHRSIAYFIAKELSALGAEIGYSLSKEYWGLGIIPEAVLRVINYGFQDLELEKIFAQTDLRNLPSQSVMKKMKMTQEALFRKHSIAQNKRRDIVYYSILKCEWEKNNI